MMNESYLQHYGVLGMRWGIRKAKRYERKAAETNNRDKAEKYMAKSRKLTAKHTRRAGGKHVVDYTRSQSMGKTLVKSLLAGTYGTLRYNELRANDVRRGAAIVGAIAYKSINAVSTGLVGIAEPRLRK